MSEGRQARAYRMYADILNNMRTPKGAENTSPFMAWIKQQNGLAKDKATVKRENPVPKKDSWNYLKERKADPQITKTTYTGDAPSRSRFSDPKNPKTNIPVNFYMENHINTDDSKYMKAMGGGSNQPTEDYSQNDIISTLETPTSKKMGWSRPGWSTMVANAAYNPNSRRLNLQYRDKQGNPSKIFPYYDVDPETVQRIVNAKGDGSVGHQVLNTIFKGHGTTKADQITDIQEGM